MQTGRWRGVLLMLVFAIASAGYLRAESQTQNLPDAPQPQQTSPPANPARPSESSSRDSVPAPAAQPRVDQPAQPDSGSPPTPMSEKPAVDTTPATRNPVTPDTQRLFTLVTTTNFVEIPVTVKDRSGR
ncbi:MAG TPA: hypothetical protein VJ453_13025, partial [Terriglobales bacterium]|nr:hypothetical protein [Terriglobales bacterium]